MTDDQDDLFAPGATPPGRKPELLRELSSLKGLLDDELHTAAAVDNNTIPVLNDVVVPSTPGVPSEPAPKPAAPRPAPSPALEQEMEAMVERIIDKEMPRIRVELKRVMLAELRLRGVLK